MNLMKKRIRVLVTGDRAVLKIQYRVLFLWITCSGCEGVLSTILNTAKVWSNHLDCSCLVRSSLHDFLMFKGSIDG